MSLIVYLEETGDHSLGPDDNDFPIFVLVMFICEVEMYVKRIVPQVYRLKMDYFGHEGVILHSRDIRKAQGDFAFLTDVTKRHSFYERINSIMGDSKYKLIVSIVHKQQYKERYTTKLKTPYDLALTSAMERLIVLLEEKSQFEVILVAESRGKREDRELQLSFLHTISEGTERVEAARFKQHQFRLEFRPKTMNIIGTQLADLAAYPTARNVLRPDKANPAYDIIKGKLYNKRGKIKGLENLL